MLDTLTTLAGLALPQLLDGAIQAVGGGPVSVVTRPVANLLHRTFVDNSAGVERALRQAQQRAWRAIELALAGRTQSWMARLTDGADATAFAKAVHSYLDSLPTDRLPPGIDHPQFAARCLAQLHAARAAGLLGGQTPHHATAVEPGELAALATRTSDEIRFRSPQDRIAREWDTLDRLAGELGRAGYDDLVVLVSARPPANESLLAAAVKYFFRQAVEEDERLHRGLTWATWEAVTDDLRGGLRQLEGLHRHHAQRLEQSLTGLATRIATSEANNHERHRQTVERLARLERLLTEALSSSERLALAAETGSRPVTTPPPKAIPVARVGPPHEPSTSGLVACEHSAEPLTDPPARLNAIFRDAVQRLSAEHPPTEGPDRSTPPAVSSPGPACPPSPNTAVPVNLPAAFRKAAAPLRRGQPVSDLLKPRPPTP